MKPQTIDIISLGCSKNLVDAEKLMRQLELLGYHCTHDSANPKGEIAVINTCGFIGDAKEESINTILQFAQRKTQGKLKKLYVMGCLSERYLADLEQELPEVDKFFGKFNFMELIEELKSCRVPEHQSPLGTPTQNMRTLEQRQRWNYETFEHTRVITTPKHYAYLKIAEGCNRFCSYCAIPLITGRYQSQPIDNLILEAQWLRNQGVRELQIIAQDLSYYGIDKYGESRLAELVNRLADIDGIDWIRLHYAYPTQFPYDILKVMRERDNVCAYLDLALQHSSDNMLRLMRRHITKEEQIALIHRIREEVPNIHLRTTLMVGHPGETEADFADLLQFTKDMRFERMGAFAYSHEEGTYSFNHYKDDIPEAVKQDRLSRLMSVQETIAAEINATKVGQTLPVMIDRKEGDYYIGRTEYDSPEVDNEVLIPLQGEAVSHRLQPQIGHIYPTLITSADTFDLYGEIQK